MTGLDDRRRSFKELGYTVLNDFTPAEAAMEARALLLKADWDHTEQIRAHHFSHVFKTDWPTLPREDEPYIARFSRAESLERNEIILNTVKTYMAPALEEISGRKIEEFDLRVLKMDAGDVMRTHIDDYAGDVGFIWYLCERWVWDWGGILSCAVADGRVDSAIPAFNQLVVVNHGQRRVPHWVSVIADYAQESRLMLVGFSKR